MIGRMALVLAAAVAGALLTAGTAQADDFASCQTPTAIVGFEPGLLEFTEQTVDVSVGAQYFVCESSVPELQYVVLDTTIDDVDGLSCTSLLVTEHDATTLHWNGSDTDTSHFAFDATIEMVAGQMLMTLTGNIDQGRFFGATTTIAVTAAQPDYLDCLTAPGAVGATGPSDLTILDLS